jgi:hypothetical protein
VSFKKKDRVQFLGGPGYPAGEKGTITKTDGPGAGQFWVEWDDGDTGWMFADELKKVEGESCT